MNKVNHTGKSMGSFIRGLLFALALIGVVYVAEMNALSTQGYEISELQKDLIEERDIQTRREIELARNGSIAHLKNQLGEERVPSSFLYVKPNGALVSR
jgi:hypothetical protein